MPRPPKAYAPPLDPRMVEVIGADGTVHYRYAAGDAVTWGKVLPQLDRAQGCTLRGARDALRTVFDRQAQLREGDGTAREAEGAVREDLHYLRQDMAGLGAEWHRDALMARAHAALGRYSVRQRFLDAYVAAAARALGKEPT